MINGIIFDMDGVIIDTLDFHNKAFILLFKEFGVSLTREDIQRTYGRTSAENISCLAKKYGIKRKSIKLNSHRDEIFLRLASGKVKPMPGAEDLIRKLHGNGYKLAIASSSKRAIIINLLKYIDVFGYFEHIISAEDVKRGKPNPDVFLAASSIMRLKPRECVVIEDASTGLKAAKKAGMAAIIIPNAHTRNENFSGASIVVRSAEDLVRMDWDILRKVL